MNLYIKQKVFSFKDKFFVYDEMGNERYCVEGEVFSFGKKLHVYDKSGSRLADINQEVFSFMPKYRVTTSENRSFEVKRLFTFFQPEYTVEPFGWRVIGNFFEHCYEISNGAGAIAQVERDWFTFGDAYAIRIADGIDAISAISVVLIIDACIEQNDN